MEKTEMLYRNLLLGSLFLLLTLSGFTQSQNTWKTSSPEKQGINAAVSWLLNYKGVNHGWGDLHISIYDLAKIGCLVMNDGIWNGQQIISNGINQNIAGKASIKL